MWRQLNIFLVCLFERGQLLLKIRPQSADVPTG